ncbi:MAG: hypothetical protein KKE73_08435 [Proteobacteria bacterium]|nr:hypothetical protein [Pseudomonadota bacterium]
MRSIAILFGYIIIASVALHAMMAITHEKWAVYLFFVAFLFGWFLTLGVMIEENKHRSINDKIKYGVKFGLQFLRDWAMGMGIILGIALILAIFSF